MPRAFVASRRRSARREGNAAIPRTRNRSACAPQFATINGGYAPQRLHTIYRTGLPRAACPLDGRGLQRPCREHADHAAYAVPAPHGDADRDARPYANADANPHGDADRNAYSHANARSYAYGNPLAYPYANADARPDSDPDSHAYADRNANAHAHSDAYRHVHAYAYVHADRDADDHAYAHARRIADARPL